MSRRQLLTRTAAFVLAASTAGLVVPAIAQDAYPSRPITLIVPNTAGGSTDLLGRALAEGLSRVLKQTVVVENKPGGNGTMGVLQMKRSQPDGYALTMVPLGAFRQPYLQTVAYHPLKDLSFISTIANYSYAIAVRPDSKWKTIQDLVNDAKAQPDSINYGTSAMFSTNHLLMVELGREAGARWTHVPHKGDSEALAALLGGHIQAVSSTSTVLPYAQSGKVRVLATGGETRSKDFPDVPTLKEAGYPVALASPLGIGGPAGLPPAIVVKLDEAIASVLKDPAFIAQAEKIGIELQYRNHQQYAQYAERAFAQEKSIIGRLAGEVQK